MPKKVNNSKEFVWGKKKDRKWIYISAGAVVVIGAVLGYIVFGFEADNSPISKLGKKDTDNSALSRRALDGVYVSSDQANHYPVGIMIENLVVSRPQSGLASANLVYEALVEGGITRFLAFYTVEMITVPEIGPIRSARPYFLDWTKELNAIYMHAGGSSQAISDIQKYDIFDLDQFYNSQYYWRDNWRDVASEHTLYSSGELISFAMRDNAVETEGDYTSWKYTDDISLDKRPTEEKNIMINFSSFNYQVDYKYDRDKNDYIRSQAGELHLDRDGTQIRAKNIIIQKVKTNLVDQERLGMETIGDGEAIIFSNGEAIVGTWEKKTQEDRTVFFNDFGEEIEFNAGATWVEVVPTDRTDKDITYN